MDSARTNRLRRPDGARALHASDAAIHCARSGTRGESRGAVTRRGGTTSVVNGVNMTVLNQFAENSGGQAFLLSNTFIDTGASEIDRS